MKHKSLVFIILSILLLCPSYAQTADNQDDPFTCAVVAFNEGMYEISLDFLDKYFEKSEAAKNEYAFFLYGINLLKLKKYDESLKKFEEFTKNFPDSKYNRDAWRYKVILKMFLNMPFEAYRIYIDGIPVYGRETDIEKNLGNMLLNEIGKKITSGDTASTKEILDTMEQIFSKTDISYEIMYFQGLILYQENDFELSVKKFLGILDHFKNQKLEVEILLKIGDCFFNMKNYVESERYYNKVISNFPGSSQAEWASLQKAVIYKRNMHYKEARKILAGIIKTTKKNEILVRSFWELGKISELENRKDEAISWYNKILEVARDTETILNTKLQSGYLYFNQKLYEKSIEIFSEYLKHRNDEDVLYTLGLAFFNSSRREEAINTWELLIKQNPGYPLSIQVLKAMYGYYKEKNDREKMKKTFIRIWETYPEDNFVLTEGIIFLNEVLNTEGIEFASNFLNKVEFKKNPEVLFLDAKIMYLTGKLDESEQILKNIDRKSVFAAEALYLLIEINLAKSRLKEAQTYYIKLLAGFPNTVWTQKAKEALAKYKSR